MFAGHIGAGLAIARAEPRINVGVFVGAALLLDVALWLFILLGWESVAIPADFPTRHQPEFTFPWSHGLPASLAWSALAGVAVLATRRSVDRRARAAMAVTAAGFSHWVLDVLVHDTGLPLGGPGSPRLGFGLWNALPAALAVEAAIVATGLALFLPVSGLSRARRYGLATLVVLLLGFTIAGMTVAPPPPSPFAMAASSLVTLVLVVAFACWLGRRPATRRLAGHAPE